MKFERSNFFKLLCFTCAAFIISSGQLWAKTYNVGILQDGTYSNYDKIALSIKKELNTISEGQFDIRYPKEYQLNGHFDINKIKDQAQQMLKSGGLDLIFSIGQESSKQFINTYPLKTPVVAVAVEAPVMFGYINPVNMKPVNPNWTTSYDTTVEASVMFTLNELLKFKKMTFISSEFFYNNNHSQSVVKQGTGYKKVSGQVKLKGKTLKLRATPDANGPVISEIQDSLHVFPVLGEFQDWIMLPEGWAKKSSLRILQKNYIKTSPKKKDIQEIISERTSLIGLDMQAIAVTPENYREVLKTVQSDVVFVSELFQFSDAQIADVYKIIADKNIPTISGTGVDGVEKGALFSAWKLNYEEMGRIFALKGYSILSGTPPSELSIVDRMNLELTFNMAVARKINFNIPVKYLYESDLVEQNADARELSLKQATELALKNNYSVKISEEQLKQTESQIGVTRATLLPQLSSNVKATQIDDTRADAVEGTTESETVLNVTLSQKIWDSAALEALDAARLARSITKTGDDITKANLTQNVIQAYMDVLQAREVVKTRQEHLRVYRNLREIAQLKYELQATGKNDVLQVDSQYDDARIQLTTAIEDLMAKTVTLNNLLNLPRNTRLSLKKLPFQNDGFEDKKFVLNRLKTILDLKAFGKMIDKRVLNVSYDMITAEQQLEQAILEKEQASSAFMPTVDVSAAWFRQLADKHKEYTGSNADASEDAYDDRTKTGWSASLTLTVPLFTGGSRYKKLDAANQKIAEYTYNRNKVKADLLKDSRILQNTFFNNQRRLEITENMREISKESFDLGQVSYQEGSTSMSDLLTLQTNLISSEISLISSKYQMYSSIVRLLRMVNHMDILILPVEQIDNDPLLLELEEYFASKR